VKKNKLLVVGHGRHGKDTVCELLRDYYGYTFESSSSFCSKLFIFDLLKDKYNYINEHECYADRHNHRKEWFDAICNYNKLDGAKLGRELFKKYDVYCGLRNKKEYYALKNTGVVDYVVWVDASDRKPLEAKDSMTLEPWMADYIIDNNESLEQLEFNVKQFADNVLI